MGNNIPQVPVTQKVQPGVKDVSQTPQKPPVAPQTPSSPTPPPNKPKKRLTLKILIILIVLVSLGIGGFFIYKNIFVPEKDKPVEVQYKGVWMALLGVTLLPSDYLPEEMEFFIREPIFSDLDKAEEAGIDTFAIGMGYWANEQGEVSMPPKIEELLVSFIENAHAKGFKIWLIAELAHPVDEGGNPRVIPEEWLDNTDLIENFKDAIIETAIFAEEHDVEMFSPANEMHVNIGGERSRKVLVEIKPRIDVVYGGKICLKGEWPGDQLSEYSCFGPTVKIPRNEQEKQNLINKIERSTKDKNIELMIGELYEGGSSWQDIPPEEIKRNFETALEVVEGKVNGVFILDITRPTPLFPESFEKTIKEFYLELE